MISLFQTSESLPTCQMCWVIQLGPVLEKQPTNQSLVPRYIHEK